MIVAAINSAKAGITTQVGEILKGWGSYGRLLDFILQKSFGIRASGS